MATFALKYLKQMSQEKHKKKIERSITIVGEFNASGIPVLT